MTFRSEIVAGNTLIREAIQSQNYQPGTAGWVINADGTAEFSDLTVRSSDGSSSSIVLANGQIVIRDGADVIVVELDATGYRLYNGSGTLVAEITLAGGATNDPGFIAYNPSGTRYYAMLSRGFLEFGEDGNSYDVQPFIEHTSNAGDDPLVLASGSGVKGNAGAFASAIWRLVSQSTGSDRPRMEVDSDFAGETDLTVTGDVYLAGSPKHGTPGASVDMGKGLVGWGNRVTNTATVTTTETVGVTANAIGGGNITFEAGRAYEIQVHQLMASSVAADIVRSRIRRTNAAGTILGDSMATVQIPAAANNVLWDSTIKVRNTGVVNISDVIVATYHRIAGTGNVQISADATNPATLTVRDIGEAADYPNARAL